MMRRFVSTTICGNRFASASAQKRCVATERPATRPVSARIKAPEHRETNVAPAACCLRSQHTTPEGIEGSGRFVNVIGMINNRGCGVPPAILRSFNAKKKAVPTVQLIPEILADLQSLGPDGDLPLQRLFTQMCNWKDFSSLEAEKRDWARASVEALRVDVFRGLHRE